jgi:C4-dicarboxylate transporter, DctQ subunit
VRLGEKTEAESSSTTFGAFEQYLAGVLLISVFLLLMLQVITRYIFNNSLSWSEELLRFLFVTMVYLSISYAGSQDAHVRIEVHMAYFPGVARVLIYTAADLLWILYNLFVIKVGIDLVLNLLEYPFISSVLRVSMAYVYAVIPVGFGLLTFRVVQNAIRRISRYKIERRSNGNDSNSR